MIVAVLLIGILGAIGSEVVLSGLLSTKRVNENNAGSAAARYGMERMSREIREIASVNNVYRITSAQPTSIAFLSMINQPTLDVPTEIAFQAGVAGAGSVTLARNPAPGQPAPVLISDVTNFSLTYYRASGATTTVLNEIRAVRIDMTVKSQDSPPIAVSSYVALMN
jgi:type II secretory pathway pseudopilin PulG